VKLALGLVLTLTLLTASLGCGASEDRQDSGLRDAKRGLGLTLEGSKVAEELAVLADKAIAVADDTDAFCGYLPEMRPKIERLSEIYDELQTLDGPQPTAAMLKRRDDTVAGLKRFEKDCESES
jgi:hypothetical protein